FTFVVEPRAGWLNPGVLRGSVRVMGVPEYAGVPPGVVMRRTCNVLFSTTLLPMKYPSVAFGSSLSTPCGANGPGPEAPLVTLRNAVGVGVPPLAVPRRVVLGMTNASDQL